MPQMHHRHRAAEHCENKPSSYGLSEDVYSLYSPVSSHPPPSNPNKDDGSSESHTLSTETISKDNVSHAQIGQNIGPISVPDFHNLSSGNPEQELDNHAAELKDAGRNMRYCEEEEKFVNKHSRPLSEFMETLSDKDLNQYLLSDKELRFIVVMDIVFPALKKSICFTKRSVSAGSSSSLFLGFCS